MSWLIAVLILLSSQTARAQSIQFATLFQDARKNLDAIVRKDTSNPPGNEILVARYLKEQLDREGIPAQIYTSVGTRSSLIGRLRGSGTKRPLMLMCHTDVVPADKSEWSTDPFIPTEKDGYLYGRGAADIKSMCAAELAVILWLKRSSLPLARDIIYFAEADEETGSPDSHIQWLIREHPEALDAELAINEGGKTIWENGKIAEMRIQAAEKEYVDVTLTAHGQAGHPSVPRPDNALFALSRAVEKLSSHRFPANINPVVRTFLERQKDTADPKLKSALREVLGASKKELDRATDQLAEISPEMAAMLRDTLAPTILKAGYKSNVIPASAQAIFNARLLPGRKVEDFIATLQSLVKDKSVDIIQESSGLGPIGPMPMDTPLYRAIESAAKELAPGVRIMPFMSAWSTDSQYLRSRGVTVYGLDPPLTSDDEDRVHGKDERISLAGLDAYTRLLLAVVLKTAGAP